MKYIYIFLIAASALLVYSCGKHDSSPSNQQQKMIVGKWTLQKEISTGYVDGVQQPTVTTEASDKGFNYTQFNGNNSFISISLYNSGGVGSTSLSSVLAVDTLRGNYNFSGAAFNLTNPILPGFITGTFSSSSASVAVMHLVSQSARIVNLTASALTLHVEYETTQTIDSNTKSYKSVLDYYFTR
jgi:uncharacterized protein YcfL